MHRPIKRKERKGKEKKRKERKGRAADFFQTSCGFSFALGSFSFSFLGKGDGGKSVIFHPF